MNPHHHLDPATLISHAAGALPPEMAAVVAVHLLACAVCRRSLARAEAIGGALLEQQRNVGTDPERRSALRGAMLERLAQAGNPGLPADKPSPVTDPDHLPAPLRPYFGDSYRALKWRWMGPGRHFIRHVGASGCTLLLLRIAPGKSMPMHGHGGNELTQILRGAYDDALGHFAAGDIVDLDSETSHQPVTAAGTECLCVAALDAPLRFPGWLARKLQPVFRI